jgi:hypothetical protein
MHRTPAPPIPPVRLAQLGRSDVRILDRLPAPTPRVRKATFNSAV